MSNLDEEIERAEEEQRQEELEALAQQERRERIERRKQQIKSAAVNAAKRKAKQELKQLGKQAVKQGVKVGKQAAKRALLELLAASSPYWGTVLFIILVIVGLVVFIYGSVAAACDSPERAATISMSYSLSGSGAVGSLILPGVVQYIDYKVCSDFYHGGASGGGGATDQYFPQLDVVVTSAYRAGATTANGTLSAHGRGEALDIALRNPTVAAYSNDARIADLVDAAKKAGFYPPYGDTLNEYAKPAENATGGHIHVEFNTMANGDSWCDRKPVQIPPQDLVSLLGVVPVDTGSTSDPRVRPCMMEAVQLLFNLVGQNPEYDLP